MRSTLLLRVFLITLIILMSLGAHARNSCRRLFLAPPLAKNSSPLMDSAWSFFEKIEDSSFLGNTKRSRKKERKHLKKDLEGVQKDFINFQNNNPHLTATLDLWTKYIQYWDLKIIEFESLPLHQQRVLKKDMEVAISIGLKHLVSFLEAKNHRRWKLGRLQELLSSFKQQPDADIETALFLLIRTTKKYFSEWDFIRCKY